MIRHTHDIDPQFDRLFLEACAKIACKPIDLLGVMFSESGCRPSARNPHGNASGLIQFMPDTLRGLGWKHGDAAFRRLSASQQLPYVIAYYRPWAKDAGAWDSAGRLYQATFLPATLRSVREPGDVLAARGGRLGWAFEANQVFDANGDGRITLGELTEAVQRNCRGSRWAELVKRLGLADVPSWALETSYAELLDRALEASDDALESFLRTPHGTQAALERLGYDLGEAGIDGQIGEKTRTAIRAFQERAAIHVDAIVGPDTRIALVIALRQRKDEELETEGTDEGEAAAEEHADTSPEAPAPEGCAS